MSIVNLSLTNKTENVPVRLFNQFIILYGPLNYVLADIGDMFDVPYYTINAKIKTNSTVLVYGIPLNSIYIRDTTVYINTELTLKIYEFLFGETLL